MEGSPFLVILLSPLLPSLPLHYYLLQSIYLFLLYYPQYPSISLLLLLLNYSELQTLTASQFAPDHTSTLECSVLSFYSVFLALLLTMPLSVSHPPLSLMFPSLHSLLFPDSPLPFFYFPHSSPYYFISPPKLFLVFLVALLYSDCTLACNVPICHKQCT